MNDGKVVRVPIPALTEERRKEMAKHLHKVLEEHRTAVRNIRRTATTRSKKLAKDKKISEDEEKRSLDEIQKLTDEEIRKMEEMSKTKEKRGVGAEIAQPHKTPGFVRSRDVRRRLTLLVITFPCNSWSRSSSPSAVPFPRSTSAWKPSVAAMGPAAN